MSINGGITNASLTSSLNTISLNINPISGNVNTITRSSNNLTNYISTTNSGDVMLTCNKFYYNSLSVFKPQKKISLKI